MDNTSSSRPSASGRSHLSAVATVLRYVSDKATSKLNDHLLTIFNSLPSPPNPPSSPSQKTVEASADNTAAETPCIEFGVITAYDITYDKYVASRGYRAKGQGVGGNLSRTRFEQLRAAVVPFDVKRFKQLVNSMEAAIVDFGGDAPDTKAMEVKKLSCRTVLRMLLTQQKTINERHDALEKYVKASILEQTKIIEERYIEKLTMMEKKHEEKIEELWMALKGKTSESTVEDLVEMY